MRMIGTKRDSKKSFFRVAAAPFLLCMVLSIASAQESPTPSPTPLISDGAAICAAVVVLIAFVFLVWLGYSVDKRLYMGEMRRAIAGTFVVGFTILMILSLKYGFMQTEIVMAYIELVGIIIGFYFGQRSVAAPKPKTEAEEITEKAKDYLDELKST